MSDRCPTPTETRNAALRKARAAIRVLVLCAAALGTLSCANFTYPDWWPGEQANATKPPAQPAAPEVPEEDTKPDRSTAEVQRMLTRLGYDPGPADGVLGHRTKAAIEKYRRDGGLPPGDAVDIQLIDRLEDDVRTAERRRTITYRSASHGPFAEAGDIFVYSDGTVETVLRRTEDLVWWGDGNDREFQAYSNFLLPRWQRGDDIVTLSKEDPGTLWPAPDGGQVEFQVARGLDGAGPGIKQDWRCAVRGKRRIEVPAGQADSLIIGCARSPVPDDEWEQRIWYYSPALGHFVRREDYMPGGNRSRIVELVAIRPGAAEMPPAARAGLDWALQQALQNGPEAKPTKWTSSAVQDFFVIRVMGESGHELGGDARCLSYTQQRFPDRRYRVFAGIACRDPITGSWAIPYLGPVTPPLIPASR